MKPIATAAVSITALLAISLAAGDPTNGTNASPARALAASDPTPVPPRKCNAPSYGLDLPGNDIGSKQEPGSVMCWVYCGQNPSCQAWTWTNHQGGTCWLKGGHGSAVFNAGAVSGIKYPCSGPYGTQYLLVENCDILGNDGDSRPGRSYWDCIGVAAASFTWSDHNGGTCWFKTTTVPCQYAPNKFTGVLVY